MPAPSENPDLFWGVRGGSGNFGVVTIFEFRLHPMQREVVAGRVSFPIERARDVLSMWADYAPAAPDDLYLDPVMIMPPGGAPGPLAGSVVTPVHSRTPNGHSRRFASSGLLTATRSRLWTMSSSSAATIHRLTAMGSYLKGGFISKCPIS